MEQNLELKRDASNNSKPLEAVVETVTTVGIQIRETLAKAFDQKAGKSYYDTEYNSRSVALLIPNQSRRPLNYGSIPSTSSLPKLSSTKLMVNGKAATSPSYGGIIDRDNYFSEFADSVPTITIEKLSNSDTYVPDKQFASFINPDVPKNYNLLTVETNLPTASSGDGSSSGFHSGLNSPAPTTFETNLSDESEADEWTWKRYLKIAIVVIVFLFAAGVITVTNENVLRLIQISASNSSPYSFPVANMIPFSPWYPLLTVTVAGSFATPEFENSTKDRLLVSVREINEETGKITTVSEVWEIPIFPEIPVSDLTLSHTFSLRDLSPLLMENYEDNFVLFFETTTEQSFPMFLSMSLLPEFIKNGALFGGLVIIGLYILIIFELMNRTLSAMLAAAVAIGLLSLFKQRPTTEEMVSWLDMETLILLFSMMIMVSIVCETGFFNYCAFKMYKLTRGAIWPMITALCVFTGAVSAFLDNVTTILLMTPVTIRICEAMQLNPVPVLISIVIFSNIGGAATPVGDPPNVIIANDPDVIKAGIDFAAFVSHMLVGIVFVSIVAYIQLRITFRSMSSLQFEVPYVIAELKREVDVWSRAASALSTYSKDECQVKAVLESKVHALKRELKRKKRMGGQTVEGYRATLAELEESCRIKDWPLLIKSGVVLTMVMILFFIHSIPQLKLSMGWTALLGAVLLLTLADKKELDAILARVEWSTLIFFSALFIVMEAVSNLGLLDWIGTQTEALILQVNPESRTIVAIHIILWVSGIASAFIDNIPFTTMMIKIVTRLAASLKLPLNPLVWALAFGTCLGGNGTIIGASANVVCAGVADQHGYRFTFWEYFRIGFPMTIVSLVVSSAYLTICYYIGFY